MDACLFLDWIPTSALDTGPALVVEARASDSFAESAAWAGFFSRVFAARTEARGAVLMLKGCCTRYTLEGVVRGLGKELGKRLGHDVDYGFNFDCGKGLGLRKENMESDSL